MKFLMTFLFLVFFPLFLWAFDEPSSILSSPTFEKSCHVVKLGTPSTDTIRFESEEAIISRFKRSNAKHPVEIKDHITIMNFLNDEYFYPFIAKRFALRKLKVLGIYRELNTSLGQYLSEIYYAQDMSDALTKAFVSEKINGTGLIFKDNSADIVDGDSFFRDLISYYLQVLLEDCVDELNDQAQINTIEKIKKGKINLSSTFELN
jgi:hypothetical protein